MQDKKNNPVTHGLLGYVGLKPDSVSCCILSGGDGFEIGLKTGCCKMEYPSDAKWQVSLIYQRSAATMLQSSCKGERPYFKQKNWKVTSLVHPFFFF